MAARLLRLGRSRRTPLLVQFEPSRLYGVGVAPVVWRWNFLPLQDAGRCSPSWRWAGLWTTDPIPERHQALNFTAHWGGGVRWHTSPRDSVVVSYRFQHFSNGNQLSTNPGVNSHVLLAGWSRRSAR